jgi:predicted metal-dependent hydrolase
MQGAHQQKTPQEYESKFRRGVDQFNTRRFFEAHESWEEIWLGAAEPEKSFLQGIIQITAAFHHYTHGNFRGARSLMDAGLRRLGPFPPGHNGIALEQLRATAREWVLALAAERDLGTEGVPQIVFVQKD